jgi:hypothetical protein
MVSYFSFRSKQEALRFAGEQYAKGHTCIVIALNTTQFRVRVTHNS